MVPVVSGMTIVVQNTIGGFRVQRMNGNTEKLNCVQKKSMIVI